MYTCWYFHMVRLLCLLCVRSKEKKNSVVWPCETNMSDSELHSVLSAIGTTLELVKAKWFLFNCNSLIFQQYHWHFTRRPPISHTDVRQIR